ncbi:hypothetical protein COY52_00220 [Candidatus Desantisbacteria bacterium CG_4_10_14_0_8_um_filter_48_22]|uniref:NADPH-dependent FMN reductase-like domain-containing protein n=1 Tax=Candidatus Desantisbacteria bacterium CG_4_10_14_0_8_um_filter_48_22 TaxID=1974543 RepID=A0A2M7SFK2_9BACT|nr:MAG: hypothetical protein AUJ67_08605 [Candidatus Desantisbacteria bacterium CG1_02_49_89]PIV56181.1 MAG: hypothetical protein COS16_04730 [Candidatus Desantisbacteria bacterium CG02_land_8_20_14_3_00_49_13]PIZ18280.1 MAG: hypothetical protein COY52_00220 [Candidatus Desantisbacteria bacterium CG_4_10_14_0_8_um_filter_48_22]
MKVLAILGSRNPDGQTAKAVKALLAGVEEAGAQMEQVFLPQIKIEHCEQEGKDGWGLCTKEGKCVLKDDFASVAEKIRNADAVVFATPVYFSDLSESLRAFLDRLRRICMHENGRKGIGGKDTVGVCVAGGGGGGAPECCASLQKILGIIGFNVIDIIPARRQNLDMKTKVLKIVGKWLVTQK